MFECKDKYERDQVLNETKFKIMGPYLVSRRSEEQIVFVTKLQFDDDNMLKLGSPEKHVPWRFIKLNQWMGKKDLPHLHLYHVPRSSHWHVKSRIQGCKEMSYYENLLQISIRNQAVIYDLDHPDASEEVKFIYNTGQFVDLDNYVNTGFTQTVSYDQEEDETKWVNSAIVFSNEKNGLHFKKEMRKEISDEPEITTRFSGVIYQTYAEIDVCMLQQINSALAQRTKLPDISDKSLVSTFEGHTMFSLYYEDIRVYEQIYEHLAEKEFEDDENTLGVAVESAYLRRLMQILQMPTISLAPKKQKDAAQEDNLFKGCWTQM